MSEITNFKKMVRLGHPNSIKAEIFSVQPMAPPNPGPWEIRQRIEIYDPRQVMDGNPCINKVLIQRVAYRHYLERSESIFYIEDCRLIETIKEYSYEEWDTWNVIE